MTILYEVIHNPSEDGRGPTSTLGYFDTLQEGVMAALGANGYGADGTVFRVVTGRLGGKTRVYGYTNIHEPLYAEWSRPNRGYDFSWKELRPDELLVAKSKQMMNRTLVKSEKNAEVAEAILELQAQAEKLGYTVVRNR